MAFASTHRHNVPTLRARLHEIAGQWREARAARRTYVRTHHELSALSNRELTDLGIDRSQINAIAMDAAYGTGR